MNALRDGDASKASPVGDGELDGVFANFRRYPRIALAVSGGADSLALMRLAHAWSARTDNAPGFTVLTVDHGLRAASAMEAEWVKSQAAELGLAHHTLAWESAKPVTGIQAKARAARYTLMSEYCRKHDISALATAHTAEDQAETLLMRLGRGSGVDGLSGIAQRSTMGALDILRPLLDVPRSRLVAWLMAQGQHWVDDPSNDDEHYERVRIRHALKSAHGLGLSAEALALSARRLRRARDALNEMTMRFLRDALTTHEAGYGEIRLPVLFGAPEEIALKCLSHMARTFGRGGDGEPPRMSQLEAAYATLRRDGRGVTLCGCRFALCRGSLLAMREFGRMELRPIEINAGDCVWWDGRFTVSLRGSASPSDTSKKLILRALGIDGLAAVSRLRGRLTGLPRVVALTVPSLWQGDSLRYVPFVDWIDDGVPFGWLVDCDVKFRSVEPPTPDCQ
jgi:tRNA(Ile)-lysidine synthase